MSICINCKKEFFNFSKRSDVKYCSKECKNQYHLKIRKEKNKGK